MKKQVYRNHVRYYTPHHFIFLPVMSGLLIWTAWHAFTKTEDRTLWLLFALLCFSILYLAIMVRQHYALGNQDRIVRLEFRLRYYELFGVAPGLVEEILGFHRIAALRFAGDAEFKNLLKEALEQNKSADEIKKSIKNWKPDSMRL